MSTRISVGFAPLALAAAISPSVFAQHTTSPHHKIEEIIVTGQVNKSKNETALPVSVLSGEALREVLQVSLGDTLKSQPGVHSASFGTGVGRPIIRGQSGNRVRVLKSGLSNLDASAVSPDHANGLSPLAAERIEVLRGPATLLFGNGAIGGVVNVIDNRIPDQAIESAKFVVDFNHNTNNDQNTTAALFEASSGNWQWHIDGNFYDSGLVEIPGDAARGDDDEGEEQRSGIIGNSDAEGDNLTLGSSFIGDNFYVGWSINQLNNDYGLPPGVHQEESGEEEVEEEEVEVRIEQEQTRYELKGQWTLDGSIELIEAQIAYTDYQHEEIEIELGEHDESEEEEEEEHGGTLFSNEGFDSRLKLQHQAIAGWSGIVGAQWQDNTFGGEGEEAYIGETDISSLAIFAVESLQLEAWTYELGARLEQHSAELSSSCDQEQTTISASGSALRQLNEQSSIWASVSYSERAATEEELFSNADSGSCQEQAELVEHVATGQIELGNPDLDKEASQNIELGWRTLQGRWQGEVNVYYNQVDDYIFLSETGINGVVFYDQQDATFYGAEAQFTTHLMQTEHGHLDLSITGDWVQGELDNGDSLPRITPARLGTSLGWSAQRWSAKLSLTEVLEQSKIAPGEVSTNGYSQVQVFADYHLYQGDAEWSIYARGNNLLDEDIRDHTSFIKDAAPAPGIGFEIGTRFVF